MAWTSFGPVQDLHYPLVPIVPRHRRPPDLLRPSLAAARSAPSLVPPHGSSPDASAAARQRSRGQHAWQARFEKHYGVNTPATKAATQVVHRATRDHRQDLHQQVLRRTKEPEEQAQRADRLLTRSEQVRQQHERALETQRSDRDRWQRKREKLDAKKRLHVLQIRRECQKGFDESLVKVQHACAEGKRALADVEANVPRFLGGTSWMNAHERMTAARAILAAPTRLLAKLCDEGQALEQRASRMQQDLLQEAQRLRDAGNDGIELLYLQMDTEAATTTACLLAELRNSEDTISSLREALAEEQQCRFQDRERLKLRLAQAEHEREALHEEKQAADACVAVLREQCAQLKDSCAALESDHAAELATVQWRHEEQLQYADDRRVNEVHDKDRAIQTLKQDKAIATISMTMRLRNLERTWRKEEHEFAVRQQQMRDEQAALELEMERKQAVSQKLHKEKDEQAAAMMQRLARLKKLQEQALGVGDVTADKAVRSRTGTSTGSTSSPSAPSPSKGGAASDRASPYRARQLLYWEVLRSRMEQSTPPAQKATRAGVRAKEHPTLVPEKHCPAIEEVCAARVAPVMLVGPSSSPAAGRGTPDSISPEINGTSPVRGGQESSSMEGAEAAPLSPSTWW